ncbi:MFS transporter [Amycolatopsis sp. cg5]|uniref:MFS transporter n=1 Tax=Amycolatopsis sp. cg5 TaxID=3238802 RepID=UPI003523BC7F
MTETLGAPPKKGVLWTPEHRFTTGGLLLLVTLVAFEAMGVATAMPTMVAALHGQDLYSWPFTGFLVASVVATVLSGRLGDRKGPVPALLGGLVVFVGGLLVAGSAQNMATLLAGRVLQGVGSGFFLVAFSLLIALTYTDRERPVMYAATAAAWVLPAVLGPFVGGLVTVHFGWRWVFLGLVPFVAVGTAMLVVVTRRLPPHVPGERQQRASVTAAVATALGIAALSWAAQHPSLLALAYGAAALVVLAVALRKLLPTGTLSGRRGLPTVVAARGLIAAAYASMEAFLPLTMSAVHGYSPSMAGLPLTLTALGWSAGSAVQGRYPDWSRENSLRLGFALVALGLVGFLMVSQPWLPGWIAFVVCTIGGAGMGIAMPAISVLLYRYSPESERGFNTSALQLVDWVGSALLIGVGGVLLAALASAEHPGPAVAVLAVITIGIACSGVFLTGRWPEKA